MEEAKLIEKLKLVEQLLFGAATEGEKGAASEAQARIKKRLKQFSQEKVIEQKFSVQNVYEKKLLIALLSKHGLKPYRYYRQRYTTLMVKTPKSLIDEIIWPEFLEITSILEEYLDEVTDRVIKQSIHETTEVEEIAEPKRLS